MTHIYICNLTIIGSYNGLLPGRGQAIIWTNAKILLIGTVGTNFSEILIDIHTFSFNKMHLKVSSVKRWTFCLGLNELMKGSHSVNAPAQKDVMFFIYTAINPAPSSQQTLLAMQSFLVDIILSASCHTSNLSEIIGGDDTAYRIHICHTTNQQGGNK